jgi:hypothetical protein
MISSNQGLAERIGQVEAGLLSYERAWALCKTYLEQGSWHLHMVHRAQAEGCFLTQSLAFFHPIIIPPRTFHQLNHKIQQCAPINYLLAHQLVEIKTTAKTANARGRIDIVNDGAICGFAPLTTSIGIGNFQ